MYGSSGALRTTRAAALSRLSVFALAHPELGAVLDEALRVVRETLETDFCAVLERAPGGDFFHRRAVSGAVVDGPATVSGLTSALAVHAMLQGASVVVRDARSDPRFEVPAKLHPDGVVSGVCAVVPVPGSAGNAYGVLSTYQGDPRDFSDDDVDFVEAVASVIGAALVRRRVEERLRAEVDRERRMLQAVIDQMPAGVVIVDTASGGMLYANEAFRAIWQRPVDVPSSEVDVPRLFPAR